ncbi:hypothetical protein CR513_61269, partial [Mucuna pruriens]
KPRRVKRYEEDPRKAPLDALKCKIPPFVADGDINVDEVLVYVNYDDYVKVWMVTYEFSGYAFMWWNQYIREVREGRKGHINTWMDLKRELRTRLILYSYLGTCTINYIECIRDPKV